jgi:hypothetical protein
MKNIKTLGLISSILLIINYVFIGPLILVESDAKWICNLLTVNGSFLYPLGFVGFYLALYFELRELNVARITNALILICGIGAVQFILGLVNLSGYNSPDLLSSFVALAIVGLFIFLSVVILKNKDKRLAAVKRFIIVMICAFAAVFAYSIVNIFCVQFLLRNGMWPFDYINLAYVTYGIGYVFGLFIFANNNMKVELVETK